jgi:uncharacterized protein with ParB-like and HNH nuclease domain
MIQEVTVKVCSFNDLFMREAIYPIAIDTYQRTYIWCKDKVQELVNDLNDYLQDDKELPYYMGNVLLHQHNEKQKLFIIDGQQRLTTLCILYFVLLGKFIADDKMAMEYHSPLSAKNIKNTQLLFEEIKEQWQDKAEFP